MECKIFHSDRSRDARQLLVHVKEEAFWRALHAVHYYRACLYDFILGSVIGWERRTPENNFKELM